MTVVYYALWATGTSSDTKPTAVPSLYMFIETDTLHIWMFDGASWNVLAIT